MSTISKMKPKKIKARKMWGSDELYAKKIWAQYEMNHLDIEPHFSLPADAASVEAMVEQIAEMIFCTDATDDRGINLFNDLSGSWQEHYRTNARAALAAIGIK